MTNGKEVVNFKGLKAIGWPNCRTHTMRLMETERTRSSGDRKKGTYREWVEPNPDPFPQAFKLGEFKSSPLVWWLHEVIAWLERKSASRRSS